MEKKINNPHYCSGCGKELDNLSIQSPMVQDELWNRILAYYGLWEDRPAPKLPAMSPQYVCSKCMERALGRKLTGDDLKPLPFNIYFQLRNHNVPFEMVIKIQRLMAHYIRGSKKYTNQTLQSEVDFMNGVLMPFINPGCEEYVKSLLFILSDQQLKDELNRREKERRSQLPPNIRCRDCKHCIEGLTFKHQVIPTTVCKMKPKPSQGPDRYYSTVCSYRACDKFEQK